MSNGKTVLVVEDDSKLLLGLQKRLMHAGYQVLTAMDGTEALALAREEVVDAISLDVRLSGDIDGLEVAAALQKDPRTARIPILFVTGSANDQFDSRCKAVGGRYFISKPYDPDLLIQTLRGIFGTDELSEARRISTAKRRQLV